MDTDQTDVVQPQEGQGDGGQGGAPYQEYLDRIPEDARGYVEPIFKEWDANTTRRFQDNAERLSAYEPYEQAGLRDVPVEDVQSLLQLRDVLLNDPNAAKEWWDGYAQQAGLTQEEAQQQAAQQSSGVEDFFAPDTEQFQKLLDERLNPLQQQYQQLAQQWEQQQNSIAMAEGERILEEQLSAQQAKHPDAYDRDMIENMALKYVQSDPEHAVERAMNDLLAYRSQVESGVLKAKAGQPLPAESGGVADGSPSEPKSFDEAAQSVRNILAQARQS